VESWSKTQGLAKDLIRLFRGLWSARQKPRGPNPLDPCWLHRPVRAAATPSEITNELLARQPPPGRARAGAFTDRVADGAGIPRSVWTERTLRRPSSRPHPEHPADGALRRGDPAESGTPAPGLSRRPCQNIHAPRACRRNQPTASMLPPSIHPMCSPETRWKLGACAAAVRHLQCLELQTNEAHAAGADSKPPTSRQHPAPVRLGRELGNIGLPAPEPPTPWAAQPARSRLLHFPCNCWSSGRGGNL